MPSVLIVGSGIAGLVAAQELAETHEVTLITKGEATASNTVHAQGGIAAVTSSDDSVEAHVLDTLRAGAGVCDYAAVDLLCTEGPQRIQDLIRMGVAFDRSGAELARGREAAHSQARVLHAGGDATGAALEHALVARVRASAVNILEHAFLSDLIVEDGRVVGIELVNAAGETRQLYADTVVLASGGAGQLYRHTTNPAITTGDGVAAAWRAGAELSDLEFYQFHPTALALPGNFLVSEAVRGEGAVLLNAAGERFMLGVHTDAELAPRDVVARAIAREMAAQAGQPVHLDATALGKSFLAARFPTIDAATRVSGFDWSSEPIPITPAAHYWMGGVATDLGGRSSLPGLYAIGEVACTGVHGANRLASNSLLEGAVFAHRAAVDIRSSGGAGAGRSRYAHRSVSEVEERPRVSRPPLARTELQHLMWQSVGLSRSAETLEQAAETLAAWRPVPTTSATIAQREDANLLELAQVIVEAALAREESRGAHFRSDAPTTSPDFARHLTWSRDRTQKREGAYAC